MEFLLPEIDIHDYTEDILEILKFKLSDLNDQNPPKISNQVYNQSSVLGFGANSSIGTEREYNEDRYIVIENASMPENVSPI